MGKKVLIWLALVFILFGLNLFAGEDKGTRDSIFYYPLIITIAGGLLYFVIAILKGFKFKK